MEYLNPASSRGSWWLSCILLVLLTIMQYSCSSLAARVMGNETDRMALLDIKLQMSDLNGVLNSWNDSYHHCQWSGVSCNMRHRRVTNLTLRGKTLSGTISPYIGNLSFIKGIILGENSLQGEIPQQIGQLSRLRVLHLSNNLLSGGIPVNFSRWSKLRYINLNTNNLIGEIPSELGSLTKLKTLYAGMNNLTGRIPASLGNLSSSLIEILLAYNNLEGYIPSELGSLSRLLRLGLGPNMLSGQIPSSLFNISTLTIFSVTQNFLHGKLPTNLGLKLPNLQFFFIGGNNLSGEIPLSFTNCTYLQRVDFGENKFEGKVPPSVGKLLNLQVLNLDFNFLRGSVHFFLESLTNCTNLMDLDFSSNHFSGKLSNTIGNLSSQLTKLYFGGNNISGPIPVELGKLVQLEILTLEENSLTCSIPPSLAKLQNLNILNFSKNRLSGKIPPTLCTNMTYLFDIKLSDNSLGGDLRHSFAKCRSLQSLNIDGNKFSGIIPSQIFGPSQFSGIIPSQLSDCLVITLLDLNRNQFSGSLPPSLASLKGIEHLDLSDNTLTGPIPKGMNHLVYLKYLNLSYNDLEGEVPTDGVFSNASQVMLQGNIKLCGGISELGLPACPVVRRSTKRDKHLKIMLIPIFSALVLISITLFMYLCLRKRSDTVGIEMPPLPSENKLRVSYHGLFLATNEFSPASLIGSGNFGFVYKGSLVYEHEEIKVVAVKVLDLKKRGASKSFMAECKVLSNLRHRNLVPLLTYCSSIDHKGDDFKALVYKYMDNGSLDTWLHPDQPHESPRCLNLLQRLNIAVDVASALDHLHNHSHVVVAHCDVKPSNILLDDELTAYVGDFGLAKLLPQPQQGASSSTTAIKGTIGYAAPEYAMGMEVSTQGDVYSYGILLLEMFTGKKPTSDAFIEGLDLHSYVRAGLSDQVWEIVDPLLVTREDSQVETRFREQECIISALKLGIGCSQEAAKDRMDMKQVTRELHFIRDLLRLH